MNIVAGVDCHRDFHLVVIVNAAGAKVAELSVLTTDAGYEEAIKLGAQFGVVAWGLEGSGALGRPFAETLTERGSVVYEIPGQLTKRSRRHSSHSGNSDAIDALAIAQTVLREAGRLPRFFGKLFHDTVQLCYSERESLVRERTQAINRLRSAGFQLGLTSLPRKLVTKRSLSAASKTLRAMRPASEYDYQFLTQMSRLLRRVEVYVDQICEMRSVAQSTPQRQVPRIKVHERSILCDYRRPHRGSRRSAELPECGRVRNAKRNRASTLLERPQRLRTTQRTWEPSVEQAHSHSRDDPSTNEGACWPNLL